MNVRESYSRTLEQGTLFIRIAAETSLPPSISLSSTATDGQTDRQTTWPGEQRRGKRAVSLGQQRQRQQQQLQQQSWVLQGDQLCQEDLKLDTTGPPGNPAGFNTNVVIL